MAPRAGQRNLGRVLGEGGPQFFLKQVQLPPVLHDTMFNPKYRIPLYESVFHDSVVSTDRWELPFNKFPAEKRNRALSTLLNVAPMMYALNKDTLDREGADLAALQTFYSKLSDTAGTEPLSTFEWLTSDRLVQRTVFGDRKLTVTANFGDVPYADVAPGCVAAEPGGVFCP
ncbi:glycoside hydrolase [Mycobacteroides chelonae]|nr:glycoside hydrolase [Mycobacteroides chelonae]MEC4901575.1 glycoside hydrolase [Mycobacteroides chelonae]